MRHGALGWVVPQRCSAASREGGQLVTTPTGSPLRTFTWFPSGFGWFGSGCCTETRHGKCQSLQQVQVTLYRLFYELFSPSSSPQLPSLLCSLMMLSSSALGSRKNNCHHFGALIPCYSKHLATGAEFQSLVHSLSLLWRDIFLLSALHTCLNETLHRVKKHYQREWLQSQLDIYFRYTEFSTSDEE